MRNISFALTTPQIRNRTKTVTRRLGWVRLQPGTLLQPVVKAQGLKKGEHVEKIGAPIRFVSVRREPLGAITQEDCAREGFPRLGPKSFITMFVNHNRGTSRHTIVTRIEFEYVEVA